MMGEKFPTLNIKIYEEISMSDWGRIVLADPINHSWHDLYLANHNIFRIDRNGHVMWQVRRDEQGYINWDVRNRHAKEDNPLSEGYMDSFAGMGRKFFRRHPTGDLRPYHPKFFYERFDTYVPGSLLALHTLEFEYDLDPETGIATCTGMHVK